MMSDGAQIILAILGILALPVQALLMKWVNQNLTDNKKAIEAVAAVVKTTNDDMTTLKEQTNHIKDALVAVTEKEAHARGVMEGRELPSIHQVGPAGIPGPTGEKGDTGSQGEKGDTGQTGASGGKGSSTGRGDAADAILKKLEEGVSIQPLPPK